ncbi:MAG TPA: ferritin-like domain-containing protein [Kofleriaceae bacterium]|nr:ferritin-like domain-containing protein [Kofleriaceae bacterium]
MKHQNVTRPGENHTGIALHPQMTKEMIEGTVEFGPTSSGNSDLLAQNRIRVARISQPVATMPPVDLAQIRDDEHRHMQLVEQLIVELGGDPTVVTPCANLQATASRGIGDVLLDPRTNLVEGLDAILIAELTDRTSWEMLGDAAQLAGKAEMEPRIRDGERVEAEHLEKVRTWLNAAGRT